MLIESFDFRTFVVMQQDFIVGISLFAHNGSSDLAQAYTMSPSGSGEEEPLWHSILQFSLVHDESGAEQMGTGEGSSDFQFLADGKCGAAVPSDSQASEKDRSGRHPALPLGGF